MSSESPPRVGSAAARSDTHSVDASLPPPVGAAAGAAHPPTPKLAQRFVNPVAQREKVAERAARAQRRKSRVMRSPPVASLSKEVLEAVAAFGLLVRSVHSKSFSAGFPNATVVDPSKVPRATLKGTSLSWLPAVLSSKVQAPKPLPRIVGKCLRKKRPTQDELLQIQSTEAIRASISMEAATLLGNSMNANRNSQLTFMASLLQEPKSSNAKNDGTAPYGMEDGYVTSFFRLDKGMPVSARGRKKTHQMDASDEAHEGDGEGEEESDDEDDEYRFREEEPWDRGDGFNDIGEHNTFGKRNLCALPLVREWQHDNIPKLKMAIRSCDDDVVENIKTLLDSPRSVFVLAEAGVLPNGLCVSAKPQVESQRQKLLQSLQEKYIRLTHKISQEDFIQLICQGERPHSSSSSQRKHHDHHQLSSQEEVTGDDTSLPRLRESPHNRHHQSTGNDISRPLKQFREHTRSLTSTWSHHQELAAKRLSKEQKCVELTREARERKVLISRAMQSVGNLAQVRALEASARTPPPATPGTALSSTSPAALMILPRCGSMVSDGTRPTTSQAGGGHLMRQQQARRSHSCCSNCSSHTYRSDDDDLFLEKGGSDASENDEVLDAKTDTIGSAEYKQLSMGKHGDGGPAGRAWSPTVVSTSSSKVRVDRGGKESDRMTPLELVRLQYKQAEAKRIADAEAALERKEQAAAAAMEKLRQRRDAQKRERILRSKEVQEKNARTKRVLAFESLQLVNKQEYNAKVAAKRAADEMEALRRRSENAMRRQLVAYEAKETITAAEKSLQKDLFALEVHAHSVDDLLHSKEAQTSLVRRIRDEKAKEREWQQRHLLDRR